MIVNFFIIYFFALPRLPIYWIYHLDDQLSIYHLDEWDLDDDLSGCGHFGDSELTRPSAPPSYHMLEYLGFKNQGKDLKNSTACTTCLNTLDVKIFSQGKDLKNSTTCTTYLRWPNLRSGSFFENCNIYTACTTRLNTWDGKILQLGKIFVSLIHISISSPEYFWWVFLRWSEGAPVHVTWVVFYGHGDEGAMPHKL